MIDVSANNLKYFIFFSTGHVLSLTPARGDKKGYWEIEIPPSLRGYVFEAKNMYAVQLQGRIICRSADCGKY